LRVSRTGAALRHENQEGCINAGIFWVLDPWRWDGYVVPKRR